MVLSNNEIAKLLESLTFVDYVSFSDLIEESIYLPKQVSDSRSGYYSFYYTPFFKFIAAAILNRKIEQIGIMCPSQIGKSQLLCNIALVWALINPSTVLYYMPSQEDADTFCKTKVIPTILASPDLSKLLVHTQNDKIRKEALTKSEIVFSNGSRILFLGTQSKGSFIGKTAPLVILDELDRIPVSKVYGDPIDRAWQRTASYAGRNRKLVTASTVTTKDVGIEAFTAKSKVYQWGISCPECHTVFTPGWQDLKWAKVDHPKDEIALMLRSGVIRPYLQCPHCPNHIEEKDKYKYFNGGTPVVIENDHIGDSRISLKINGLYNLQSWGELASQFLLSYGDKNKFLQFKQEILCEPDEDIYSSKGNEEELRTSETPFQKIDSSINQLVAGIDVQGDRCYYVVLGLCGDYQYKVIDWGELHIGPVEMMATLRENEYQDIDNPERLLKIDWIGIDTRGYRPDEVLKFIHECDNILGFFGVSSKQSAMAKVAKDGRYNVEHTISNDALKRSMDKKELAFPKDGGDPAIFKHIGNEVEDTAIRQGRAVRVYRSRWDKARVDYRDCLRYCYVLIDLFDLNHPIEETQLVQANAPTGLTSLFSNDY